MYVRTMYDEVTAPRNLRGAGPVSSVYSAQVSTHTQRYADSSETRVTLRALAVVQQDPNVLKCLGTHFNADLYITA